MRRKETSFLLRDIPLPLWREAREIVIKRKSTLRKVLLDALSEYCRRESGIKKEERGFNARKKNNQNRRRPVRARLP